MILATKPSRNVLNSDAGVTCHSILNNIPNDEDPRQSTDLLPAYECAVWKEDEAWRKVEVHCSEGKFGGHLEYA